MPSAFGNLNGSGPQQVWLNVSLSSQSIPGNYSDYLVEVRYYGNGYGSWSGSTQSWSANIGGSSLGGTFTIPQSEAFDTYKVLTKTTVRKTHNADGTLAAFTSSATINTDHGSIGDGSVSFNVPAPARIPRGPRVRVAGTWENTVAYVRVAGVWKVAIPYVNVAGTWKVAGG